MRRQTACRCCGETPLVGYFGLCKACSDAVSRFIIIRRSNLRARSGK